MAFFLAFYCAISCSHPCRQWELIKIKADCPPITYYQAYLSASNPFNGIEIELLSTGAETQLYLNVLALQFPHCPENENQTEVTICIDDMQYVVNAERFLGGQRLLLPEEAQQLIICALIENRPVDISAGRYQATIVPDNFLKIYRCSSVQF